MSAERAHLRVVPDPEEATAKDGQRQIKAIMFSDIKGYSAMMGKDEDQAFKLLDIHNRLIESRVETFHGTIIKYIGDAVLASFSSAVDAADCALSIQTEFARINKGRPRRDQIWIRIGLHLGDVLLKDGDVFGDGVNLASRLEPLSQPGGIVVSGTIKDTIQANPRFQIEPMGEVQLKNIPYRVWAFQILTPSSGNPLLRKVFKKWEGIKNTLGCELPNKIDPGCQRILFGNSHI